MSRLTDILIAIVIATLFGQAFGSSAAVRAWAKRIWKSNNSEADKKLDELISTRNSIVHVAQPTTRVEQNVIHACEFFEPVALAFKAEKGGMPGS